MTHQIRRVKIGRHVLFHGDCLSVMDSMADGSVDMIWTDPPYGHGNHVDDLNSRLNEKRELEQQPIANDSAEEMRFVVDGMLSRAARVLSPDCCCCCCCCGGGGGPKPTFAWLAERMDRDGLQFFHSVIWDKINPGLGWRYRRQHEMIMISHRKGGRLLWRDDARAVPNIIRMSKPRNGNHPNEKPEHLVAGMILNHAAPGKVVLDPFMGSGTTGLAAIIAGCSFVGIELDAAHFETACERIRVANALDYGFGSGCAETQSEQPSLFGDAAE